MLLLFGIPLLYMEMIMGQWLRIDSTRIWKQLVPCLGGIGYASILVREGSGQEASPLPVPCSLQGPCLHPARPSGPLCPRQVCIFVSLYNSIIISWSLSYLGNSFYHPLPWNECPLLHTINFTGEERE